MKGKLTKFKVGDAVEWTSSASGTTTTKTGRVVAVIPAGEMVDSILRSAARRYQVKPPSTGWFPRDEESYVVLVQRTHAKTGKPLKPKLYYPRTSKLSRGPRSVPKLPTRGT